MNYGRHINCINEICLCMSVILISSFAENLAFLIGAAYFVSGSYEQGSLVLDAVDDDDEGGYHHHAQVARSSADSDLPRESTGDDDSDEDDVESSLGGGKSSGEDAVYGISVTAAAPRSNKHSRKAGGDKTNNGDLQTPFIN